MFLARGTEPVISVEVALFLGMGGHPFTVTCPTLG